METNSFFIENLQPSWLNTKWEKVIYIMLTRIFSGILVSVAAGYLLSHPLEYIADGILGGTIMASLFFIQKREGAVTVPYHTLSRGRKLLKSGMSITIYVLISVTILYIYHGSLGNRLGTDKINFLGFEVFATSGNVGLILGFFFSSIFGLRVVKQTWDKDIRLVETTRVSALNSVQFGLLLGMIVAVIASGIGMFIYYYFPHTTIGLWMKEAQTLWSFGLFPLFFIMCLPVGFLIGMTMGWSRGDTLNLKLETKKDRINKPNYGMLRTLQNSVRFTLIMLFLMILYWAFFIPYLWQTGVDGMYKGAISALAAGLMMFMWWGGLDILQYWVLRLILFLKGRTPRTFTWFLQDLEKLSLVLRTGAQYHFPHQTFMEFLQRKKAQPQLNSRKNTIWSFLLVLILGCLIYPAYYMYTGKASKSLWSSPNHGYINFDNQSADALVLKDTNQFLIQSSGQLELTVTGKIRVGDFTGYVNAAGTEAAFFAMPIKDGFDKDCCLEYSHGALVFQNGADISWHALIPAAEKNIQRKALNSPYTRRIDVVKNTYIRFDVNDKEPQNNSGAFLLKMKFIERE